MVPCQRILVMGTFFMIDKAVDMAGDRMDLVKAKLYIENYAMGNVDAAEFAQAMADDDAMRQITPFQC